jgi:pimeloyl-ACP methyl ester carboxylesterase
MSYFNFEGHRVYYTREGAGDPIVFLPNATLTGLLWEHQAEHFKQTNDVIVVDLPGFGRSDRLRPTLDLYVRWLGRFVDELELAPVALVGNCIGSLTALRYAVGRPDTVRALVLLNMLDPVVGVAGIFKPGSGLVKHRRLRPPLETWFRHMPNPDRRHPLYWRSQFGAIREPHQQQYLEHSRRCWADPETRLDWLALGYDSPNEALPPAKELAGLPPVCWIWGRDNRILPYEVGKRQLDVLHPEEAVTPPGAPDWTPASRTSSAPYIPSFRARAPATGASRRSLDRRRARGVAPIRRPRARRRGAIRR